MSAYLDFIECLNGRLALLTCRNWILSMGLSYMIPLQGSQEISIEYDCLIKYSSRHAILCTGICTSKKAWLLKTYLDASSSIDFEKLH